MIHLNPSKSIAQNFLDLVNTKAKHKLSLGDFNLGTPTSVTPDVSNGNKNTEIVLTYSGTQFAAGQTTIVHYDRVAVSNVGDTSHTTFEIANTLDSAALKSLICASRLIDPNQVTLTGTPPTPGQTTNVQIVSLATSPYYTGSASFTIINTKTEQPVFYLTARGGVLNSTDKVNAITKTALSTTGVEGKVVDGFNWNNDFSFRNYGDSSHTVIPYQEFGNVLNGNFTIEFYGFIHSTDATARPIFNQWNAGGNGNSGRFVITYSNSNKLTFRFRNGTGTDTALAITTSGSFTVQNWFHFAVTRNGNEFKVYLNGVLNGTATYSSTTTNPVTAKDWAIGKQFGSDAGTTFATSGANLNYDELTVWDSVKYTADFVPGRIWDVNKGDQLFISAETTPPKNDVSNVNLNLVSGITVSTDQKKSGNSSLLLAGGTGASSAFGLVPVADTPDLRNEDFALTFDVYPLTLSGVRTILGQARQTGRTTANSGWNFHMNNSSCNFINYGYSAAGSVFTSASSLGTSRWNRVRITRKAERWRLYIDGVLKVSGAGTVARPEVLDIGMSIGNQYDAAGTAPGTDTGFHGYLDNVSIRTGVEAALP